MAKGSYSVEGQTEWKSKPVRLLLVLDQIADSLSPSRRCRRSSAVRNLRGSSTWTAASPYEAFPLFLEGYLMNPPTASSLQTGLGVLIKSYLTAALPRISLAFLISLNLFVASTPPPTLSGWFLGSLVVLEASARFRCCCWRRSSQYLRKTALTESR